MRENALIRLRYRPTLTHLRVGGVMRLRSCMLPFHYHVPLEKTDFDHDAKLNDIEARGLAWEDKLSELGKLRGWEGEIDGHTVKVLDCTIYPVTVDNWMVTCVFVSGGQQHRLDLEYVHPAHAPTLDDLKTRISLLSNDHHRKLTARRTHMEGLSVLADLAKAAAPRSSGGG
jgi:hypothetical protein